MEKFKTSWNLFRCSLSVIGQNKLLLLFPVIEFVFIVIIFMFFISPIFLWNTGHTITDPLHWDALGQHLISFVDNYDTMTGVMLVALGLLVYLISMFFATFFNVVFYNEILNAINGKGVSIFRGIRAALSKINLIMIWSFFAGIVGLIIRTLEVKLDFIGRWIMALIGIAWSVACIFIIPVIIREDKSANPLKLLKTSALMLKKTWGETIIGFAGFSSVFLIIFIPFLIIMVLTIVGIVIPEIGASLGIPLAVLSFFFIIFMSVFVYFAGVARHVYRGALYVYASEGVVPGPFDEDMMNRAWKVKKVRKE